MKNSLFFLITVLILMSCSTTYKEPKKSVDEVLPNFKDGLRTISMKSNMAIKFPDFDQQVLSSIKIAGADSVSINIIGPFGIVLGKLYSNKDHFLFYNTIENTAMEGTPNAENLERAMRLPLSFNDFMRLLRCETPSAPEQFIRTDYEEDKNLFLFKNDADKRYIEYALYSPLENAIVQYQRKLSDGRLILNVHFKEFQKYDEYILPRKIAFSFPDIDGAITLNNSGIKINENDEDSFSFSLPEGIKKIRL